MWALTDTQREEDHVRVQGEGAIFRPRMEASDEVNPANTLILDFKPPEL